MEKARSPCGMLVTKLKEMAEGAYSAYGGPFRVFSWL